jgi:hypothetical protein
MESNATQALAESLDQLNNQMPIRKSQWCQQFADSAGLIVGPMARLSQQLRYLAIEDGGELKKPVDVGGYDPSLYARNGFVAHTKALSDLFLRQAATNALLRDSSANHAC